MIRNFKNNGGKTYFYSAHFKVDIPEQAEFSTSINQSFFTETLSTTKYLILINLRSNTTESKVLYCEK